MGLSGYIIVARTDRPVGEAAPIAQRGIATDDSTALGAGWHAATVRVESLTGEIDVLLRELSALTSAPSLSGYVVDSDFVLVDRDGPPPRRPLGVLARGGARAYLGDDLDAAFPPAAAAAQTLRAWANEAGLDGDGDAVDELFRIEDIDHRELLAEHLFWRLLAALTLVPTAGTDGGEAI